MSDVAANDAVPGNSVRWQIEGPTARLNCGSLQAQAGCSLVPTHWKGQPIRQVSLLAVGGAQDHLVDLYIRGNDFVARYAQAQSHSVETHAYWRAAFDAERGVARVERVLSVQTDLLDSRPALRVGSFVSGAQLLQSSNLNAPDFATFLPGRAQAIDTTTSREHLFVYRREDLGFSYAEMVHPSDFVSAEWALAAEQHACVFYQLFPDRLEKGVIRRGRVCGWFLPTHNDLAVAVELARQFVVEPLPLTT
jgi:hypothetical protein